MVRCMIFLNWRSELYIFTIISGGRSNLLQLQVRLQKCKPSVFKCFHVKCFLVPQEKLGLILRHLSILVSIKTRSCLQLSYGDGTIIVSVKKGKVFSCFSCSRSYFFLFLPFLLFLFNFLVVIQSLLFWSFSFFLELLFFLFQGFQFYFLLLLVLHLSHFLIQHHLGFVG